MEIVAIDDLGGLGDRRGPVTFYSYSPPSMMVHVLPWLGLVLLLLLPANRTGAAWWILVPVGALFLLRFLGSTGLAFLPHEAVELLVQLGAALAIGLGAAWLLAPYLARNSHLLMFLGLLGVLAAGSIATLLVQHDWSGQIEAAVMAIPLALFALVIATALSLAARRCRADCGPGVLNLRLAIWVIVGWTVLGGGVLGIAAYLSHGGPSLGESITAILVLAGITLTVLAPFLLLSSRSPFHGERLRQLMHLAPTGGPPAESPPVAAPFMPGRG